MFFLLRLRGFAWHQVQYFAQLRTETHDLWRLYSTWGWCFLPPLKHVLRQYQKTRLFSARLSAAGPNICSVCNTFRVPPKYCSLCEAPFVN